MATLIHMNTATTYLGLSLPHPFIAGASPLSKQLDTLRQLEDAGCAAVVLHSLFEEQVADAREHRVSHMDSHDPRFTATLGRYPAHQDFAMTPDAYLAHVAEAKRALGIPVIASLNGGTAESWLTFAREVERAGADALELNLYQLVADPRLSATTVEDEWVRMVRAARRLLTIPLVVKVTPFFTAFANMATRLSEAGADALVLFNRVYQADIDIATATPVVHVDLSTSQELLLRLRWVAALYGRTKAQLALTGGVATPEDGIKALLAGADVVQLVSALLRHGPGHIGTMRTGLTRWLEEHGSERLAEVRGRASLIRLDDPLAFERATYLQTLRSWR